MVEHSLHKSCSKAYFLEILVLIRKLGALLDLQRKLTPEVVYTILWKVMFTKNSAVILLEKPQEPHV